MILTTIKQAIGVELTEREKYELEDKAIQRELKAEREKLSVIHDQYSEAYAKHKELDEAMMNAKWESIVDDARNLKAAMTEREVFKIAYDAGRKKVERIEHKAEMLYRKIAKLDGTEAAYTGTFKQLTPFEREYHQSFSN